MLSYSIKRVKRGWRIFIFLFVGIIISTTLFAGTNIGSNQIMTGIINENINSVYVDITGNAYQNFSQNTLLDQIESLSHVTKAEYFGSYYVQTNASDVPEAITYLIGIQQNSKLDSGIKIVSGRRAVNANETVIPADATFAQNVKLGDMIYLNITWYNFSENKEYYQTYPLKIVGFVSLNDTVKRIFNNEFVSSENYNIIYTEQNEAPKDYVIVNFDTYKKFVLKNIEVSHISYNMYSLLVWVDRTYYVNPYDIDTSINRLQQITNQIENVVQGEFYIRNNLLAKLHIASLMISFVKIQLLIMSLPIFFMAWYMGTILSSLTYNLRRREIGLLQTKGFEPKRIRRMFLTEGLFIGIISGVIGIFTGSIIASLSISQQGLVVPFSDITIDTAIITIIAGAIFGIITVYGPSGRASKMKVIDALRQYVYVEENTPYRNKLAITALILGTYKLIIWITGISFIEVIYSMTFRNIFLIIVLAVWLMIDTALNYIGPLLFFYGFAKIFVYKSMSFKKKIESFSSMIYGELGRLASKDISRNAARNASVAFILALIIGYSVSTTFISTSNVDYMNRRIYVNVGSDISVSLLNPANMSYALNNVSTIENVDKIAGEYQLTAQVTSGSLKIKVVNGSDWLSAAYYETDWFSKSPQELFNSLDSSDSIILEKIIAHDLGVDVGDHVFITFGTESIDLTVIGLFGPEPVTMSTGGSSYTTAEPTWSFISWKTINSKLGTKFAPISADILIKTINIQESDTIVNKLKNYTDFVSSISSVEYLQKQLSKSYSFSLNIRISQLLMLFTMVLATAGTFIIVQVSLSEKRREIALISVRGLSIKQMSIMLLAETSIIFIIALSLGTFVGYIMAYGSIVSQSSVYSTLIAPRIVLNATVILTIAGFLSAILLSIIIPVLFAARKGTKDFITLR